jgi:exodeoxyribonuclease VII small subunit
MAASTDSIGPPEVSGEDTSGDTDFEHALARLEEIVHLLEDGKIGLDEALGRYEEGVGLLRRAYGMLQRAERRIELLTGLDSEGNPILRPMEDVASFSLPRDTVAGAPPPARREKGGPRGGRRSNEAEAS